MKKAKGKSKKAKFILFFAFLACFAVNLSAQNLDAIAEKINYGDVEQRREALFQIRNLQTVEASRLAIPMLADADEIVRATATHSVIYLSNQESANLLLPLLNDKSEFVRRETAYALGKVHQPKAVNPLIETFQKDKILEVKNAVIVALGEIGDVSAVDFLTKLLQKKPKDEEDFLRRASARSIGQIAKFIQTRQTETVTPTSFLPEKFKIVEKPKFDNLVENFPIFQTVINVLIQVLQNPKESNDTRRESAFALGETRNQSALSILQSNLNNSDYYLAEICRESLDKINKPK